MQMNEVWNRRASFTVHYASYNIKLRRRTTSRPSGNHNNGWIMLVLQEVAVVSMWAGNGGCCGKGWGLRLMMCLLCDEVEFTEGKFWRWAKLGIKLWRGVMKRTKIVSKIANRNKIMKRSKIRTICSSCLASLRQKHYRFFMLVVLPRGECARGGSWWCEWVSYCKLMPLEQGTFVCEATSRPGSKGEV